MGSTRTVILHRQIDRGRIHVFRNDGCWKTNDLDDIDEFLEDPTTWYLTDSLESPPDESEAVTILVSYPDRNYFKTFLKYSSTAALHYLPVWSLKELKIAAPLHSRDLEVVEERYGLIGGIPQFVLASHYNMLDHIKEAIAYLRLNHFYRINGLQVSKEKDDDICSVVQLDVNPTYLDFSLRMASQYASDRALEKFLVRENQELKRFFHRVHFNSSFASLRANLFEAYAHRLFSGGGEFLMRSLDDSIRCKLHVPPRDVERFHNISRCTDQNRYYIPWDPNHACIDAVVLGTGYFKMTVALDHDISKHHLMEIVEVSKIDKLYLAVPDEIFGDFGKQKLLENRKKTENTSQKQPSIKGASTKAVSYAKKKWQSLRETKKMQVSQLDSLCQYVICISFE